jgi:hypothetical protein
MAPMTHAATLCLILPLLTALPNGPREDTVQVPPKQASSQSTEKAKTDSDKLNEYGGFLKALQDQKRDSLQDTQNLLREMRRSDDIENLIAARRRAEEDRNPIVKFRNSLDDRIKTWDDPWRNLAQLALSIVWLCLGLAVLVGFFWLLGLAFGLLVVSLAILLALVQKLGRWIGAICDALIHNRARLGAPVYSGLGAGFGMLIGFGAYEFCAGSIEEKIEEVLTLAVVALGITIIIEPLVRRLRETLHIPEGHSEFKRERIGATFLVLALASVSHGLLHNVVKADPLAAASLLMPNLIIAGGTTYAWGRGARRAKSRAAWFGALAGFLLAAAILGALFALLGVLHDPSTQLNISISALFWGFMGFCGGAAIDSGRYSSSRGIAAAGIAVFILEVACVYFLAHGAGMASVVADLFRAFGWAGGLWLLSLD